MTLFYDINGSQLWLRFKWRIRSVHCQHYTHWKKAISLLISCVSPFLADFPRLEQWTDNTSPSESSLFMDGFLYISSGPSKMTLDRRGRDGECKMPLHTKKKPTQQGQSIHQSICKQFKLHVCQRSTPVKRWSINQCQSVSCQTANRLIRTPNSPVKTINESVFQMRSASALWGYLSDGSLCFDDPAVNAPRKYGVN